MIHPLDVLACRALLCTYIWFIQQTHDEAKGPEVPGHILRVALHIFLIQYVDQCLMSQNGTCDNHTQMSYLAFILAVIDQFCHATLTGHKSLPKL